MKPYIFIKKTGSRSEKTFFYFSPIVFLCLFFVLVLPVTASAVAPVSHSSMSGNVDLLDIIGGGYSFDTGWVGANFGGVGAEVKLAFDVGGELASVSLVRGQGKLTGTGTTRNLSFEGIPSATASMDFGLQTTAQYKLTWGHPCVPDFWNWCDEETIDDLPFLPNVDFYLTDSKTFTPYLLSSSVTLSDSFQDQEIIDVPIGIPSVATVNIGASLSSTANNTISGDTLFTSSGNFTIEGQQRSVNPVNGCTPFSVNNIYERYSSNIVYNATPNLKLGFDVLLVGYNGITIPIATIPIPIPAFTFDTTPQRSITFTIPPTVTPSSGANGSISPSTLQELASCGSTTTFTLIPAAHYHSASVGGTCGGVLAGNTFTTIAVNSDCTVIANFSNDPPVLNAVGNKTVNEEALLTFTATAADTEDPSNTLVFSLSGSVPSGASITSGGVFTWTPTEAQGPNTYTFDVIVTDNATPALSDSETITVTVNEANNAPVLGAIGNKTLDQETLLTFTATATDSDIPANTLSFSLSGTVPTGASINSSSGVFTWTPTEAQGPGTYTFDVVVTDNGTPNLSDSEAITITVNDVNKDPVLNAIGNKTVDEETLLTFTVTATDPNIPANNLSFFMSGAPGASITSGGLFTWTPTETQGGGTYTFNFVVTDDGTPVLLDSETITITVNEANKAPVLNAIGNKTVDQETLLTFTATATDSDIPANTIAFSLSGSVPSGASINSSSGVFTWTPTEAQGPGTYTFNVVATDNGSPNLSGSETITITVNDVNKSPVLGAVGNKTVNEETLLTFTATATDPNVPANTLSFTLSGAPSGASINSSSGLFTWTPTEAQGPGTYTFDVVVTDNGTPALNDSETITVTVNETNHAPVLGAIGNKTVDEETLLTFTATATDADLPTNTLSFTLSGAPSGASINSSSGVFTWTPTEAQGPGTYTFDVVVTDNGTPNLSDSETISVTVNNINNSPVLGSIGDKTVDEETLLTFTATATDADLPANTLSFTLSGAPSGASINSSSGVFTWTPTEAQGPGSYTFDIVVTDNGTPALNDSETITVTVNNINKAPVLGAVGNKTVDEETLLTFTATATDADLPANTLTFTLNGAPSGASINSSSGVFTWTPTEAQGPGTYTFDIIVTDNGTPVLDDSETITVTVNETNHAPVLGAIGDKTVDEETLLTFTATATDADLPANTLTFTLNGAPSGASINSSSGVFTWTPTEAQGPGTYTFDIIVTDNGTPVLDDSETITVTVNNINKAPVLGAIGDKTVDEETLLTFTATATDADLPANTLSFTLSGAPSGASINSSSGVFTWTPTEAQGPGTYTFDVVVTDNGTPALNDSETITVTVNDINKAPVLGAIGNKTVDEETQLTFTATATDPDLPANTLTFTLNGAPSGASIDGSSGVFTWTPTEAQGPGTYTFDVIVTDNGTPVLDDSETITVTVNETNKVPTISDIPDQNIDQYGSTGTINFTINDVDLPENTLTVSAVSDNIILVPAPSIVLGGSGNNRTITITPPEDQNGTATITVTVNDGTVTASDTFVLTVTPVYTVTAVSGGNGTISPDGEIRIIHNNTGTFELNADTDYHVAGISGCGGTTYVNTANNVTTYTYITGPITSDCTVTADFSINTYELTVNKPGTGNGTIMSSVPGIDCGSDCAETYDMYTVLTLTATPDAGSVFMGWSGACRGLGDCTVTIDTAKNVTAFFSILEPVIWTKGKKGTWETCIKSASGLASALFESETDNRHNLIKLAYGIYIGTFSYFSDEDFNLSIIGGYSEDCSARLFNPELSMLNGDLDGDNEGNGLVLDLNISKPGGIGKIHVENITVRNGYNGEDSGGCIRISTEAGMINFVGNVINYCSAVTDGGGSLNSNTGDIYMANNIIHDNSAIQNAGIGASTNYGRIIIANNTLTNNISAEASGGLALKLYGDTASGHITNNIIWNNSLEDEGICNEVLIESDMDGNGTYSPVIFTYNNTELTSGICSTDPSFVIGEGNIDEDPMFIDPDQKDFHISPASSCRNAGGKSPLKIKKDIDGQKRVVNGQIDIGADETDLPLKVFPLSPNITTSEGSVAFEWLPVYDAVDYTLIIVSKSGIMHAEWYNAEELGCVEGDVCSVTPSLSFDEGKYVWQVYTRNLLGLSKVGKFKFSVVPAVE